MGSDSGHQQYPVIGCLREIVTIQELATISKSKPNIHDRRLNQTKHNAFQISSLDISDL